MGCSSSKNSNLDFPELSEQDQKDFSLIGISSEEILKFYNLYFFFEDIYNVEGKLLLSFSKLFHIPTESVLLQHFVDGVCTSRLNFSRFVILIWSFCIQSETSIASFTFDAFSKGKSNTLSVDDISDLVKFTFGGQNVARKVKFVLNEIDGNSSGEISRADFLLSLNSCYAFLFHTIDMQRRMREAVLGMRVWNKKAMSAIKLVRDPAVIAVVAQVTTSSISIRKSDEEELLLISKSRMNRRDTMSSGIATPSCGSVTDENDERK